MTKIPWNFRQILSIQYIYIICALITVNIEPLSPTLVTVIVNIISYVGSVIRTFAAS